MISKFQKRRVQGTDRPSFTADIKNYLSVQHLSDFETLSKKGGRVCNIAMRRSFSLHLF